MKEGTPNGLQIAKSLLQSEPLQPELESNLQSVWEKLNDKTTKRIVFDLPFFTFDGTPEQFEPRKAEFKQAFVEYLRGKGVDAEPVSYKKLRERNVR